MFGVVSIIGFMELGSSGSQELLLEHQIIQIVLRVSLSLVSITPAKPLKKVG